MNRKFLAVICLALAAPAAAQYRASDADMLIPPPPAMPPGVVAAGNFRAVYGRAGRPRMLVFWNRTFSDEVTSNYRDNLHAESRSDSRAMASDEVSASRRGTSRLQEATGSSHSSLDVSAGADRVDHGRDQPLGETVDFAVEAAFSDTLAANGAQLIDRSLAMRTARGARGAGARPNMQAIETEAATARADLLVEVLQTPAANTPAGASFKVTVKDIRAARVLGAFSSDGDAPPVRPGLVAGPGGFVRASATSPSPAGVGRELANRTMSVIARALR